MPRKKTSKARGALPRMNLSVDKGTRRLIDSSSIILGKNKGEVVANAMRVYADSLPPGKSKKIKDLANDIPDTT